MLVDPEPLLGMLPDDGFEAIPAGLHYLAIGGARGKLKGSLYESQHRSLLCDDAVAGSFPDLLENRRQAGVFKLLRQDRTVIIAERKKGTPKLEVSEMRCHSDRRALLLRSQESSKYVRILE